MQTLVCYGLKSQLDGRPVESVDDFASLDEWDGPPPVRHELMPESGVDGVVYLIPSRPREPEWAKFLRQGLGSHVTIPSSSMPGALLLVKVSIKGEDNYFAFTFGSGRFILRSDSYQRRFGLRVALNAVFEGDTARSTTAATRLRSIDAKRVSSNTVRMRHQASKIADFEAFDVDRDRDFLRGVTGLPQRAGVWGQNLTGADSLTVTRVLEFDQLPAFCREMARTHAATSYRHRFGWVDDVGLVTDSKLRAELEEQILCKLQDRLLDDLDLNVPEVVEWNRVSGFVLPTQRRPQVRHPELRLADYVSALQAKGQLAELNSNKLRSQHIDVVDGTGEQWARWPVWRCLTAELRLHDRTFILDEGEFYEIDRAFMNRLDDGISALVPESTLTLPIADVRMTEATYNRHAASAGRLLLLDTRTVRVSKTTSPIEICDLLTPDRQFVHVKRKLGSSLLSHLFAQGHVSADLLQTSQEFRNAARRMVRKVVKEPTNAQLTLADFDVFNRGAVGGVEVVYAIIGSTPLSVVGGL